MSESLQTEQIATWKGSFGKEYTERNTLSPAELDASYLRWYGIARTELNREFLSGIDSHARILEIGCNVGNQLLSLQEEGFRNLYGVEIQPYAVEAAKARTRGINIIEGSIFDIPFKDGWFDLVFTSGVLIHIDPSRLPDAQREINRCAARYVWGMEYFAPTVTEINYRGNANLLWKANYAERYCELFPTLKLQREKKIKYLDNENVDSMFLLARPTA